MPNVSLFGNTAILKHTPQKEPSQNSLDRYIDEGRKKSTQEVGSIKGSYIAGDRLASYNNQVVIDERISISPRIRDIRIE
jgi:hypothetical protein